MSSSPHCITRQADFRGWNACYLENGMIRLVAVPDIGGRIMAYDLGPYAYLFVDPTLAGEVFSIEENQGDGSLAAWKNYGGDKTWPAPQGWDTDEQWHGPPDPVLDTGRYTLNELSGDGDYARVRMTSPPDHRTGVQIIRQVTICAGTSRVELDLTFRNVKDHPIRWSIWDVVQLRAERLEADDSLTHEPGCVMTVPLNPRSRFADGYQVMFGDVDNPQWQANPQAGLFQAPYMWQIGKVGLDSDGGWVGFSNTAEGYAFAKTFTYEPNGEYPDNGSTVEVWTIGAGQVQNLNYEDSDIYLMEAEVLSPLRTIAPGQTTTFRIEWGACRCGNVIQDVSAAGVVAQPLRLEAQNGDYRHMCGEFGVFDTADLYLRWLDASGAIIDSLALGSVDPLSSVTLDRMVRVPVGAASVELVTIAHIDKQERRLAAQVAE